MINRINNRLTLSNLVRKAMKSAHSCAVSNVWRHLSTCITYFLNFGSALNAASRAFAISHVDSSFSIITYTCFWQHHIPEPGDVLDEFAAITFAGVTESLFGLDVDVWSSEWYMVSSLCHLRVSGIRYRPRDEYRSSTDVAVLANLSSRPSLSSLGLLNGWIAVCMSRTSCHSDRYCSVFLNFDCGFKHSKKSCTWEASKANCRNISGIALSKSSNTLFIPQTASNQWDVKVTFHSGKINIRYRLIDVVYSIYSVGEANFRTVRIKYSVKPLPEMYSE